MAERLDAGNKSSYISKRYIRVEEVASEYQISISNIDHTNVGNLYMNMDESESDSLEANTLQLLKIKEKLLKNSICFSDKTSIDLDKICISGNSVSEKNETEPQLEKEDFEKLEEYYKNRVVELERMNSNLTAENSRLMQSVELLSEEISLLRTGDDEKEILLEDEYDLEYLYMKKLVVCGGRVEWLNRIKQIFPRWKYIENDNVRFDGKVLKDVNIDAIVFNRRFVSHGLFYRVASPKKQRNPTCVY